MPEHRLRGVADRLKNVSWVGLAVAFGVALFPAFGAYMVISFAYTEPIVWIFFLGIVVFTGAFYQTPGIKPKIGAGLFWLAIEAFLAPIAMFVFSIIYASDQTGALELMGSAIAGAIGFVVVWMLAWFVGIVLYLISRRFEAPAEA